MASFLSAVLDVLVLTWALIALANDRSGHPVRGHDLAHAAY
ncbi:MAG: hypothetical protein ACRDNW_26585 [Trebonia sp.]